MRIKRIKKIKKIKKLKIRKIRPVKKIRMIPERRALKALRPGKKIRPAAKRRNPRGKHGTGISAVFTQRRGTKNRPEFPIAKSTKLL